MKRLAWLSVAVLLIAAPHPASAWRAINRHEVNPVSDTVFEVVGLPGSGAADYWCGAGDFARRVVGTAAAQRIYIWRGVGPSVTRPGHKAVQFSLAPPPDPDPSPGYNLSMSAVGDNLTSAAASRYCQDVFERIWPD